MSKQSCPNPASPSSHRPSAENPFQSHTQVQEEKKIDSKLSTVTKLTGGLKRLDLPRAALRGKSDHQCTGWNESPWIHYSRIFNCDLAGSVSIVTVRSHPSELRAIRTFKKEDSSEILEKLRAIRHENILLAREYFKHEDLVFVVFDDLPVTLDHLVACDYYPRDAQVSSILAQVLS
jgi:hypothetical protein